MRARIPYRVWVLRWVRVALAVFCLWVGATAAAPWQIPQYHHRAWSLQEGAPADVWALAQARDGYLWLGTGTGLYRFDGVQFEHYQAPPRRPFASNNITALYTTTDGALWIGFLVGGASVLRDGSLQHYSVAMGAPRDLVYGFAEDHSRGLWAAAQNGLYRFDGRHWHAIGDDWGYPAMHADHVLVDSRGTLWVATGSTLMYLPSGTRRFVPTGISAGPLASLVEAPDGRLWLSDGAHGTRSLPDPRSGSTASPPIGSGFGHFACMRIDGSGVLWGTDRRHGGVVRVSRLDRFAIGHALRPEDADAVIRKREGLTSDRAIPLLRDREGNVWVGTNLGLHRFRHNNVQVVEDERLTQHDTYGLAFSPKLGILVSSGPRLYRIRGDGAELLADTKGPKIAAIVAEGERTWLKTESALWRLNADGVQRLPLPRDNDGLLKFLVGDGGSGVLTMQEGNGLFHYDGLQWAQVPAGPVDSAGATALLRDTDRTYWIGYSGNRLAHWHDNAQRVYTADDGLNVGTVIALARVKEGLLVAGETGLALLRDGRVHALHATPADRLNGITGIVATPQGEIWLNAIHGILRLPPGAVTAALQHPGMLKHRLFDLGDGLLGVAQQATPASTVAADADGRLWFATNQGLATLDPLRLHSNMVPPSVHIRSLIARRHRFPISGGPTLPAGTRDLRVEYTAPSLSFPDRVEFRYRLEGVDDEWQDVGNRRQAFYANLGPGDYRFRVLAANDSGLWNEQGATLDFTIAPRFTETWWFAALCAIAAGLLLFFLYLLRLRQISDRVRMRLEERHLERDRIARELHDTLLQSFQGLVLRFQSIANRIPTDDPIRSALEKTMDRADEAIAEGRDRVRDLRATTASASTDLPEAFARLGAELGQERPTSFSVVVEGRLPAMNAVLSDEVYWIGREALGNAFRHADASQIEVEISHSGGCLVFRFRDDGQGIAEEVILNGARSGHWGLPGMRERAKAIGAELRLWSRPGKGTEVELLLRPDGHRQSRWSDWRRRIMRIWRAKT